jgi:gas vesicle protein
MNRNSDVIWAFLAGAAAGAATALLVAPDKGSETRRKIRKGIDDLYERGSGYLGSAGDGFRKRIHELSTATRTQARAVGDAAIEVRNEYQREMEKQTTRA